MHWTARKERSNCTWRNQIWNEQWGKFVSDNWMLTMFEHVILDRYAFYSFEYLMLSKRYKRFYITGVVEKWSFNIKSECWFVIFYIELENKWVRIRTCSSPNKKNIRRSAFCIVFRTLLLTVRYSVLTSTDLRSVHVRRLLWKIRMFPDIQHL